MCEFIFLVCGCIILQAEKWVIEKFYDQTYSGTTKYIVGHGNKCERCNMHIKQSEITNVLDKNGILDKNKHIICNFKREPTLLNTNRCCLAP